MSNVSYIPKPLFDTMSAVIAQHGMIYAQDNPLHTIRQWLNHCLQGAKVGVPQYASKDYQMVLNFLYSYRGSADTFGSYRRELERFVQWSWFVREQSVLKHKREDIESFVEFCIKPYKRWIGLKKVARFKLKNGIRIPNPEWRPFEAHVSKIKRRDGTEPQKENYECSQSALKVLFGILSSFYKFLAQEDVAQINPVALIRQKSKFLRKEATEPSIRRLSDKQWQTVLKLAKDKAKKNIKHERTVFILSCLYSMYLRISELVSHERWTPTLNDFHKDSDGNWWFKTVGKGNKARKIAVSLSMLAALKQYRTAYLKISPYPLPDEDLPLISHVNNDRKSITSERPIRQLVQSCFDEAADQLEKDGDKHGANLLRTATVHWLRHTGISDDVKHRPREHVRDDAGHSSGAITDRYIDVELSARAKSARHKSIGKRDLDQ